MCTGVVSAKEVTCSRVTMYAIPLLLCLLRVTQAQDDKVEGVTEPSCDGPVPQYLKKPHTYFYHLEGNSDLDTILSLKFPLPDDHFFRDRWNWELEEGENIIRWVERDGPSHPDSLHRIGYGMGWKHRPTFTKPIPDDVQMKGLKNGIEMLKQTKKLEELIKKTGITLKDMSSKVHQLNFTYTKPQAKKSADVGYVLENALTVIAEGLEQEEVIDIQLMNNTRICSMFEQTPIQLPCEPNMPYRRLDGSCNNLREPGWGKSFTPFRRMFPPEYADNVSEPRGGKNGDGLPDARKVSLALKEFPRRFSNCFSVFQMSFGQFIDHDLTATPTAKDMDGNPLTCCNEKVLQDPSLLHPECFPLSIDVNDPFYSAYGITCLEFVRSLPASRCFFAPREQINQLTAYIDGSAVYGSTKEQSDSLRTFKGGKLKTVITKEGHELLPEAEGHQEGCNTKEDMENGLFCFRSGDERVNEHILLALLTTLFAREHNRIAMELSQLRPEWNDERLFQETKRIVAAEIQHIAYNEFLSGLLGPLLVRGLDLKPLQGGEFYNGYDNRINAGVANEFAAAALRLGHSMIPEHSYSKNSSGYYQATELNGVVFHPADMHKKNGIVNLLRGAFSQSIGKVDHAFSNQITGLLFKLENATGFDLVGLNIQRGRDHGLADYTVARRECGFPAIKNFDDLKTIFDADVVTMLRKLYKKVEDIDLFVGGMAEKALPGGLIGPTFACILSDQFIRAKRGDRFWYENAGQAGSFTKAQLTTLHDVSLARVMCDNFPEIERLQRWPLQLVGAQNPVISCDSLCLPKLDLTAWRP
ncbi:chorion peroxidase-like [Scylla paramamosain]|uniref:chorion peroxidase-like n=1 Tax=Scylla paramamosain TaxID=85552 RepID=UPI0030829D4A